MGVSDTFTAGALGDDPDNSGNTLFSATLAEAATQTYSVDGTPATFATFDGQITAGDTIVYSRAAGIEMFALTNNTISTSFSGTTDDSTDSTADTIGYISGTTQTTFDYSAVTSFRVNGVVSTKTEFETALDGAGTLPWGEAVSYDGTTKVLSLTTANSFGPNAIADVNATDENAPDDLSNDTLDIVTGGGLVYVQDLAADTALDATTARYFVNGTEVTADTYEKYLTDISADATATGDSFQVVLTALATEHRLTTNNSLLD